MNSLNRDSLGMQAKCYKLNYKYGDYRHFILIVATDSTASDDDTPPPLPAKTRESDYSNLSDKESLGLSDYSCPIIMNNIMVSYHVGLFKLFNIIIF